MPVHGVALVRSVSPVIVAPELTSASVGLWYRRSPPIDASCATLSRSDWISRLPLILPSCLMMSVDP
jgi:hypothetical protein